MSIKIWKEEFYPEEAKDKVAVSDLEACEHAIKKFIGTLEENLKKHELRLYSGYLVISSLENPVFLFSSENCIFCLKYLDLYDEKGKCSKCPLRTVKGSPCDSPPTKRYLLERSPWGAFINEDNPKPMLELLNKVKEFLLKEQQNESSK